jgi:alcohol dehydrogenase
MLLKVLQSGRVDASQLATHGFALAEVMEAHDTFGNAAQESALKVFLSSAP